MGKPRTSKPASTPVKPIAVAEPAPVSATVLPAALAPESSAELLASPTFLPAIPEADPGKALFEVPEAGDSEPEPLLFELKPTPRQGKPRPGGRRKPPPPPILGAILGFTPVPPGDRPEWTGVYRLYDKGGTLLYVGMTNASVDRYVEHRDTKEWWPEVTDHSIEWYMTREEADAREVYTIKDEWPIHNIAHQPRANGPFQIPSHVGDMIRAQIVRSVREVLPEADEDDADEIAEKVAMAFSYFAEQDIEFCTSEAPTPEPLNLPAVLNALGPFRPPIRNSMRDPQPQFQPRGVCRATIENGECPAVLNLDGPCPSANRHVTDETATEEAS